MFRKVWKKSTVPGLHFSLRTVFSRLPVWKIMGWYPLVEDTEKLEWISTASPEGRKDRNSFHPLLWCVGIFGHQLLEKTVEVMCKKNWVSWAAGGQYKINNGTEIGNNRYWVWDGQVKRLNKPAVMGWTWTLCIKFICRSCTWWVGRRERHPKYQEDKLGDRIEIEGKDELCN